MSKARLFKIPTLLELAKREGPPIGSKEVLRQRWWHPLLSRRISRKLKALCPVVSLMERTEGTKHVYYATVEDQWYEINATLFERLSVGQRRFWKRYSG